MSTVMVGKQQRTWLQRSFFFIPQLVAVCIALPIAWMAFDRTPPLILFDGKIDPNRVHRGQRGVSVVWQAHFSGRDCPGYTSRELVDSRRNIWPFLVRQRAGVFRPSVHDPLLGIVTTPELQIPDMAVGTATYKVTQFYYCNWLQRVLHWPIVQPSPYILFEVLP